MKRVVAIAVTVLAVQSASPTVRAQADAPRPSFAEFLSGIRSEALSRGIRAEVLDAALANIEEPSAVVIERDRTQAESVQPLETYIEQHLTPTLIGKGREMAALHHDLLEQIASRYGIPIPVIVSIWGMESNYGRFSGVRPTIAALATLAWDPRRSSLFRAELFDALTILDRGDIELAHLKGSWAGAMGQVQFMPSSYLKFAEDFDGDGRRDIWTNPADIFASIANYMKGHGWVEGGAWGQEVAVSAEARQRVASEVEGRSGTCRATRDMTVALPMATWQTIGIRTTSGESLPAPAGEAALVSGRTRAFLVHHNYDALLEYNCSHAYAVTVGLLADRIGGAESAAGQPVKAKSKGKSSKHKKKKVQA
jgi:membrane-bound lytic murein transglycosylase B